MVIGLALITYPPRMTLPDPSDFPVRAVPLAPLTKERATIVCRRNGRVLLVARRQALRWTLPGGVIRRGESALAHAAGPAARPVLVLGWALLALCALVCVTIAVLLFGALVYMLRVLAVVAAPPRPPALTIGVTAHDWWWAVRYPADADGAAFVTANEIHIPVGEPVLVELTSADVIHAFWVPQLAGKTQTIPGQTIASGCRPTGRASIAGSARSTAARSMRTWRSRSWPSRPPRFARGSPRIDSRRPQMQPPRNCAAGVCSPNAAPAATRCAAPARPAMRALT